MKSLEDLGISPAPWDISDDLMSFPEYAKHVKCGLWAVAKYCRNADARLISAAPELYEACRRLLVALKNRLPAIATLEEVEIINAASAALEKAGGAE